MAGVARAAPRQTSNVAAEVLPATSYWGRRDSAVNVARPLCGRASCRFRRKRPAVLRCRFRRERSLAPLWPGVV